MERDMISFGSVKYQDRTEIVYAFLVPNIRSSEWIGSFYKLSSFVFIQFNVNTKI